MKKIIIKKSDVKGTVKISGSKNAALPIIVSSLLARKKVILNNIPDISDVKNLLQVLKHLRVKFFYKNEKLTVYPKFTYCDLMIEEINKFRASYYFMGLFLGLFKRVSIFLPGGCKIGARPIDFHLEGFKQAGCEIKINGKELFIEAKKLKPFCFTLPKKSLGATINLLLLAVNIKGTSIIRNVSTEPELNDFVCFIKKLGYHIVISGNEIIIDGLSSKRQKVKYEVMPDRIEAFTFMTLGAYSRKLKIKGINHKHLVCPLTILGNAGLNYRLFRKEIIVYRSVLKPFDVKNGDYPLLSTDQMPLLYPIAIRIKGDSFFEETIFENRFNVCEELEKTGAQLSYDKQTLVIHGTNILKGANFYPTDLRAAACLLVEGIINGDSVVHNLYHLERGYAKIYQKLKKINVNFYLE